MDKINEELDKLADGDSLIRKIQTGLQSFFQHGSFSTRVGPEQNYREDRDERPAGGRVFPAIPPPPPPRPHR